ncbi:hypothetical protein HaLaN_05178 [Haematococcus lacustris]|uniref:Uncharacterized protein n=1 Tax=Haematococcus lacustris TaxID=44745 RepID=A0A699YKW4_HAELA|nr:hypothetical protein HaLaN_05178 [Haematococcus lacustris]
MLGCSTLTGNVPARRMMV